MKLFLIFVPFLFLLNTSMAQDVTLRGVIYDASNGEAIPYEKVRLLREDSSTVSGAITTVTGAFSIPKIAKGNYILKVENAFYETQTRNVSVVKSTGIMNFEFNLKKKESIQEIEEVKVSADDKRKKNEVLISELKLSKKDLERIPSIGAENDIIGAFSVTPGVTTTGDQGGQLYVRGGTPIQNKILLDGMTIYSPFHSIGFFSVFETELIQSTKIITGGFDAQYGGRISSVMDISYRDGNRKEFGGKVSVSPFMAKTVLEGPLTKPKDSTSLSAGSYIFSAKHSLLSYTSQQLYKRINNGAGMPFTFTDLYGKVTFKGDGGSKFSAFGFHNRDSVNYLIADLDWMSSGGGIDFLLVPSSSPIFIRGHVNGSNYETTFNEDENPERTSSIGGFDLGFDFTYFLPKEGEFNYGFNISGFNVSYQTYSTVGRKIKNENWNTEIGAYLNYRKVTPRWVIQPSLRIQAYPSIASISPEPRIGLKFNATETLRLKASGGRFSQNLTSASSDKDIVNLFNGLLSAPQEASIPGTFVSRFQNEKQPKNGLQYAWHAIAGFEYDLTKNLSLNIEGYYKYFPQLTNINQNKLYPDDAAFKDKPDAMKKDFIIEDGVAYGVDFLAKYSTHRIFIWVAYSYGYSDRWDGFTKYFPVFDRRHNVNLVGTYLFGEKKDLELSIRWNLGSGLPFTPSAGFYQGFPANSITDDYTTNNPNDVSVLLGEFNSERLPYYHRLDVTLKKQFSFKNKTVLELAGSITNLYDRKNIFYVHRVKGETIYQFPILPSLGMSFKF